MNKMERQPRNKLKSLLRNHLGSESKNKSKNMLRYKCRLKLKITIRATAIEIEDGVQVFTPTLSNQVLVPTLQVVHQTPPPTRPIATGSTLFQR